MPETLNVDAPRRAVRDWIEQQGRSRTAREARTFARISLSDADTVAAEDPIRAAERLEAVAARLLYAADWLRRLGTPPA